MLRLFQRLLTKTHRSQKLLLLECRIHGSHYYDCLPLVKKQLLKKGEPLLLRREPDNQYDSHAIEVFTTDQQKLGYIPKHLNHVVAELMDQQCDIDAVITAIFSVEWEPVTIRVYMQR